MLAQLAAALKSSLLIICFLSSVWLMFMIVVNAPGSQGDCPSCWPPSLAYPQLIILPAILAIDIVIMILVARSIIRVPRRDSN